MTENQHEIVGPEEEETSVRVDYRLTETSLTIEIFPDGQAEVACITVELENSPRGGYLTSLLLPGIPEAMEMVAARISASRTEQEDADA